MEPIEIEDDDEGDESFQVVGVQKRPVATHGVLDENEHGEEDMDLEEDDEGGEQEVPEDDLISAYSEEQGFVEVEMVLSSNSLPCVFLRTHSASDHTLVSPRFARGVRG